MKSSLIKNLLSIVLINSEGLDSIKRKNSIKRIKKAFETAVTDSKDEVDNALEKFEKAMVDLNGAINNKNGITTERANILAKETVLAYKSVITAENHLEKTNEIVNEILANLEFKNKEEVVK